MKKVYILALHLAYGGVEKAITNMANLFCRSYEVEIISVYKMPNAPAYPLDSRVKVSYLLKDTPNREQWKAALKSKNPIAFARESARAVKILRDKKQAVISAISSIHDGVIISTRNEDSVELSRYGDKNVLKIAQLHHDHRFDKKLLEDFARRYENIDVFALLTPGLCSEVKEVMKDNSHTRVICVPNFLDHYPGNVSFTGRDKTLLAVGRLDSVKGFDRLIRCFAELKDKAPDWKLKIAGDGDQRPILEGIIAELGLEGSVILTGRLSPEEVEREMLSAAIFAMSSHSEGFPFVLLEAGSCGLPTVAYDVRVGPGAIINDGINGCLVPDGDGEAYAARLLELMSSEGKREELARRARERSLEFSEAAVGRKWREIIGD